MPSGTGTTRSAGTTACVAYVPLMLVQATRWPGRTSRTPEPACSTTPAASWPRASGRGSLYSPLHWYTSMKFTPLASMRTRICPGPGGGSCTSSSCSTSGPPHWWTRTARAMDPPLRNAAQGIAPSLRPRPCVRFWDCPIPRAVDGPAEWVAFPAQAQRGPIRPRLARTSLLQSAMDSLLQDLRFALRTLLRAPGFTAAAVLAFALGVGGSTAIFSVLDGVALRPLAVPEPDRLVRAYEKPPGQEPGTHSIADYLDVAKENGSFESVAAVAGGAVNFTTAAGH